MPIKHTIHNCRNQNFNYTIKIYKLAKQKYKWRIQVCQLINPKNVVRILVTPVTHLPLFRVKVAIMKILIICWLKTKCPLKWGNFYIPNQSKRFSIVKYSEFDPQKFSQRNNHDKIMRDCTVPVDIIYACRINKEYSELIQELAIDTYPNDKPLKMIQKACRSMKVTRSKNQMCILFNSSRTIQI